MPPDIAGILASAPDGLRSYIRPMAAAHAHRDLRKGIQSRSFERAYYFYGDDEYLKDDTIRQMIDAVVDPSTRDFNFDVRRGNEVDAESLLSLLSTPPMLAKRRLVIVRDVQALKKDARAALDRFLHAPPPDVVVLLVAPADGKVDKALLERAEPLEFAPLDGDRVPKWIAYRAEQLGARITPAALTLLQDAVGSDLAQLALELEKLASFVEGTGAERVIDEAAVSAIVGVRKEETLGALLDAVAARDAAAALALVPGLLSQPKLNGVQIVMALSTQMLALGYARALRERGVAVNRLPNELFNLLKTSGSVFTGRSWGDAVSCWTKAAAGDRWTAADVDRALADLLVADRELKDTRLSSDEQRLATLVLALCGAPARRARVA